MPITNYTLPQATAQFATSLRNRAIASRIVNLDFDPAPVNLGDTINVRFATAQAAQAVTPGHLPTAAQEMLQSTVPLVVNQLWERSMALTDKDVGEIESGATPQQMVQMGIDLVEKVNADIYGAAIAQAGSAVGTAGTNPFATDEGLYLDALQRLIERRAPIDGQVAVLRPDAWRRAIQVPNLVQAERRGGATSPLRTGDLDASFGAPIAVDQLMPRTTTAALGAGALTLNGAPSAGALTISIAKGAGAAFAAAAGDVLTIAGASQKYVIATAISMTAGGNTVVALTVPLQEALAANAAVTVDGVGSTYSNSLVMHRDAVTFASRRLNELTENGQNPANVFTYADPLTGMVLRAEITRQHYQSKLAFSVLYGVRVIRPELVVRLLG